MGAADGGGWGRMGADGSRGEQRGAGAHRGIALLVVLKEAEQEAAIQLPGCEGVLVDVVPDLPRRVVAVCRDRVVVSRYLR